MMTGHRLARGQFAICMLSENCMLTLLLCHTHYCYSISVEPSTDVIMEGSPGQVVDTDIHPEDPRRRVVLKADTSISLGTMYDALAEVDVNYTDIPGESIAEDSVEPDSEAYLNSRRVVRGGVGVVTTSDVMIAVAAEGIIRYNLTDMPLCGTQIYVLINIGCMNIAAPILTYGVDVEAHARRLAEVNI